MGDAEKRELEDDLRLAQEVNRSLLPRAVPDTSSWEIGIHYKPSRILSGDFYDIITTATLRDGALGIAIGDVAGKGIPAGLLRTSLQATMRALSRPAVDSPAELLEKVNRRFLDFSHPGRFASAFYGVLRGNGGDEAELVYANGGHLPPLLRRASGRWETLDATGMVLGVMENLLYRQSSRLLEPGDILVLYTDGVTEAQDLSGEFFDEKGLVEAVDRWAASPSQEIANLVSAELDRFSDRRQSDDRTLIILRKGGVRK
jgi:sigma-B regulation protein RsbU (phosphoserine phosphatase)